MEEKSFQFARIPHIRFGAGSIASLPAQIAKRVSRATMIVSGSFSRSPRFEQLLDRLKREKITTEVFFLSGEPSPGFVNEVARKARKEAPGIVVSIGGGSVVDAGKAISAMIPVDGSVKDYLEEVGSCAHDGRKVPFIAVPTTAGTGSEATKNAVLSEPGPGGYKRSLRHDNFIPDTAIVDPELTLSCSVPVSMAVGMDAMTQLVEGFTSTGASLLTDALAQDGLARVVRSLPLLFEDPLNLLARTEMSYAALLSGITLANTGLGVVHGFASVIGGWFQAPHGVVCGALIAPATEVNIHKLMDSGENPEALNKFSRIGKLFSSGAISTDDSLTLLIEQLHHWTRSFRIPKLSAYGISKVDIDRIVTQTSWKNNPVKLEPGDLREILVTAL